MTLYLDSPRAKKARVAAKFGKHGGQILALIAMLTALLAATAFLISADRLAFGLLATSLLSLMLGLWNQLDLQKIPADSGENLDDIMDSKLLAALGKSADPAPANIFDAAIKTWQGSFIASHLLINPQQITELLASGNISSNDIWSKAKELRNTAGAEELSGSGVVAAVLLQPDILELLKPANLTGKDVVAVYEWQSRLEKFFNRPKPYFGGIGRDWSTGFTPMLDRFGVNLSRQVEAGAAHYHTLAHADILDSIVHNLSRGSGSVALVGEPGSGKTSLVYALAQRLLQGQDEGVEHYQIISLNAAAILSAAGRELESIMLTLFSEAARAKNIIIFLDDARLFFSQGTGSFDAGQILGPLLKSPDVKLITAFTPSDFQHLKSSNPELASAIPSVAVTEPPEDVSLKVLEDAALTVEAGSDILISYQAIKDIMRLSGQFISELAYPGKAISLLEQSIPYVEGKIMTSGSVSRAVEKTRGVKVGKADAPEADKLLKLEQLIHQRMINQSRAVQVVAAALRRGRAGVSAPNRPVGSFLFLGPTGVGKTELARSLAATYFGDETQMIRLDMSEYQGAGSVDRLLDKGEGNTNSLLIQIRQQPFSVVLLDEIEKSSPEVLNLLLQMLDEGQLTDSDGHAASFKSAIIIATSNAGSAEITAKVSAGENLESFERPLIDKLISEGRFKPELINRFDEIVLFRPLNFEETSQVAQLMLDSVNKQLASQNISVKLTADALEKVVKAGYDPQFGARPMRRVIQRMVEDAVAKRVLSGQAVVGTEITLSAQDLAE